MIYKIDLTYIDSEAAESYGFIYQNMKCTILEECVTETIVKLLPKFRAEIREFNKEMHTHWTATPVIPKKCLICLNMNTLDNE
jgi:hypothetical protein